MNLDSVRIPSFDRYIWELTFFSEGKDVHNTRELDDE